jgi:hypothetical protein
MPGGYVWIGSAHHDLAGGARHSSLTPSDINSRGEVVGSKYVTAPDGVFLWRNGVSLNLKELVDDEEWEMVAARAIDDQGRIVGTALDLPDRVGQPVMLVPR